MSPFLLCILILLQKSHCITCDEDCQCNSVFQSTGNTCTLNCNTDNACRDSTLTCRTNDPCVIDCRGAHGCEGATIDASSATHVTIQCTVEHACKSTQISCGSGDCSITCNSSENDICKSATITNNNNARSFQCIGNQCNEFNSAPNEFSPAPTSSPTSLPTLIPTAKPTHSPTHAPTNQPTHNPSKYPTKSPTQSPTDITSNPTQTPTNIPTLSPTDNPTKMPTTSNPTQSPTDVPTNNPIINPSNAPSKSPSINPSLSPTTLSPSKSPTRSPLVNGETHTPTKSPPSTSPTLQSLTKSSPTLYTVTDNINKESNDDINADVWDEAINYTFIVMLMAIVCLCIFLIYYLRKKRRYRKTHHARFESHSKLNGHICTVPTDYIHNIKQSISDGFDVQYANGNGRACTNVTTPTHVDVLNYKGNKVNISIKPHIDDSSDSSQAALPRAPTTNKQTSTRGNIVNDDSDTDSSDSSIINGINTTKCPSPKVIYNNNNYSENYIHKMASCAKYDQQIAGDSETNFDTDAVICDYRDDSISLAQGNADVTVEGNIDVIEQVNNYVNIHDININNDNIGYIHDHEGIGNDLLNDIVGDNNGQFYVTPQ